jgi:hypothetical protein
VTEPGILTFHARHIGLTDNVIPVLNQHGINLPTICDIKCDIKVAVPAANNLPQWLKGLSAMVAHHLS